MCTCNEDKGEFNISGQCPSILDEHCLCWPSTEAGTVANQSCPTVDGFNSNFLVYKDCLSNGSWMTDPIYTKGQIWTNITSCIDFEFYQFADFINKMYVLGYSISLIPLLISLCIFISMRSLRCYRIRLHTQFFLSIILNNVLWIIWYIQIVSNSREPWIIYNPEWCQIIFILKTYFMVCTYFWMLCEAMYLYRCLIIVFIQEELVTWLYFLLIGWGIPGLLISTYIICRIYLFKDTEFCWSHNSDAATWILGVPISICLLLSLVFLIYIMRVIMSLTNTNPMISRVKKTSRAALVLIPLFGLHYFIIPIKPDNDVVLERIYEYLSVTLISLQGTTVSLLFCFANQDVYPALKALFRRLLHGNCNRNFAYSTPLEFNGNNQGSNVTNSVIQTSSL